MVARTKVLTAWGLDNPYHLSNLEDILIDEPRLAMLNSLLDVEKKFELYWTDV